jgi:hypothetical protein
MNTIDASMPMPLYHKHPAISSSQLIEMDVSPRHFYHFWKNPQTESSESQKRGTLFHDLLLEQSVEKYVARPLNEKGELVRSNSKEYATFLEANPGKVAIHPNDFNEMYSALTAFAENEKAMAMLKDTKIEHSIFCKDPETGVEIKARPDIWGNGFVADLKSTANILKFDNQIFTLSYDVRLVHYAKCIEYATGEKVNRLFFIAFESNAPFQSQIVELTIEQIADAETKWRSLMNRLSVCLKTNSWPGFTEEIRFAKKPKFIANEEISFEEIA